MLLLWRPLSLHLLSLFTSSLVLSPSLSLSLLQRGMDKNKEIKTMISAAFPRPEQQEVKF